SHSSRSHFAYCPTRCHSVTCHGVTCHGVTCHDVVILKETRAPPNTPSGFAKVCLKYPFCGSRNIESIPYVTATRSLE
ncbi:hypothetical protein LSAT2_008177, partial [Lamellibrachia satsuma]